MATDPLQLLSPAMALAVTVVGPNLLGHFLLRKTFLLCPNSSVHNDQVRGLADHFLPDYCAGSLVVALAISVYLLVRLWEFRTPSIVIGWALVAVSLMWLLPTTRSSGNRAEAVSIDHLRETVFPFASQYVECRDWTFDAENSTHQSELWQVYLGRTAGTGSSGGGCNRIAVYRGWQFVGAYDLVDDTFGSTITVNKPDRSKPFTLQGSGSISQTNRLHMDPGVVGVTLPTEAGWTVNLRLGMPAMRMRSPSRVSHPPIGCSAVPRRSFSNCANLRVTDQRLETTRSQAAAWPYLDVHCDIQMLTPVLPSANSSNEIETTGCSIFQDPIPTPKPRPRERKFNFPRPSTSFQPIPRNSEYTKFSTSWGGADTAKSTWRFAMIVRTQPSPIMAITQHARNPNTAPTLTAAEAKSPITPMPSVKRSICIFRK